MKKYIYLSLLMIGTAAAHTTDIEETIVRLYDQLAQKSSRIDTDCEEQRGSLQDVLREIKVIIDECNVRLNKALTKYPSLRQELNLKGNLTLNLSVDSDTN